MGNNISEGGYIVKVLLNVQGQSQYSENVLPKYQKSACGPTTVRVILNYICSNESVAQKDVNELYNLLGSTKIGLFKWRMIRNLQKLLGKKWEVSDCTVNEALSELRNGRPVAMKFDKYFTLKWGAKPMFNYHWVPLVGYEIRAGKLYLNIHDNGGRNRESAVRDVLYDDNRDVISFVKISPRTF
jgi:hypothetical protein